MPLEAKAREAEFARQLLGNLYRHLDHTVVPDLELIALFMAAKLTGSASHAQPDNTYRCASGMIHAGHQPRPVSRPTAGREHRRGNGPLAGCPARYGWSGRGKYPHRLERTPRRVSLSSATILLYFTPL